MDKRILLEHGGGGEKTNRLIQKLFFKYLSDPVLHELDDAARLGMQVFTTDSFVVSPLFFAGGDIGKLAVAGTVNDIAVMGARPLYISLAFIIEEGLETAVLERTLQSISATAQTCGIRVVAGDTKVVEKGKGDGLYISASGIGEMVFSPAPSFSRIREGDRILINGPIGLHAMAVVAARGQFGFSASITSDVAPLWPFICSLRDCGVSFMRDPTRGGVAQTLNEVAAAADLDCEIDLDAMPVTEAVRDFCGILGYDPLVLANEGKVLVIVESAQAERAVEIMRGDHLGRQAAVIGLMKKKSVARPRVIVRTGMNSERILLPPAGELLPRIC